MENFILCAVLLNKYLSSGMFIYFNNVNLISKILKNLVFPTHTWYLSLFFCFFEFSASLLQKLWLKRNLPPFPRSNVALGYAGEGNQNRTGGRDFFMIRLCNVKNCFYQNILSAVVSQNEYLTFPELFQNKCHLNSSKFSNQHN